MSTHEENRQELKRIFALWMTTPVDRSKPPRPIGPVYFLRCGPYIKIGYSVEPKRRLGQIRWGDGTKMPAGVDKASTVLLQTEPGGRNREYQLHQQFKHLHHWGEWFTEAPELTEYIESLGAAA